MANELGLAPLQKAGRHLIKHANNALNDDPEGNPAELMANAYSEILRFPDQIEAKYKPDPKDYKAMYEAAQRALDAAQTELELQGCEIAALRAALAEAMETETELVAAG